jgi:predicted methyltransferase
MKHLLVVVVALAACSKGTDKPTRDPAGSSAMVASGSGSGSGSGSAVPEPPPKPYTPKADVPEAIKAAIAAPDRAIKDRALDAGRMPGEVFAFFKVAPGQKIGELFAGQGYSTELLARIVGADGKVFAQNSKEVLDRFARKPFEERLAKPVMKNVVMVERAPDDPFPPEAKDLDAVICIHNSHDFVWQKVDLAKLNAAVFAALKPGGVYAIVDHSAAAGSGVRDVETLHRIDEEVVKADLAKAGFKLDAETDVLRMPDDKRDWNSSPKAAGDRRGTSDRFTLRFIKPAK